MDVQRRQIANTVAIVTTLGFLGVLAVTLWEPGYSTTRLAFFAILGALAVVAAFGVVRSSTMAVTVGSLGLFLLGIWQAALGIFILPVAAIHFLCFVAAQQNTNRRATGS